MEGLDPCLVKDMPCISESLFLKCVRMNARKLWITEVAREALRFVGESCSGNHEILHLFAGAIEKNEDIGVLSFDTLVRDGEEVLFAKCLDLNSECSVRFWVERKEVDGLGIAEGERGLQPAFQKFGRDKKLAGEAGYLAVDSLWFGLRRVGHKGGTLKQAANGAADWHFCVGDDAGASTRIEPRRLCLEQPDG